MMCAVLCAVSAFFYAPMEVSAEEYENISLYDSDVVYDLELVSEENLDALSSDLSFSFTDTLGNWYFTVRRNDIGSFDLNDFFDLESNSYYSCYVTFTSDLNFSTDVYCYPSEHRLIFGDTRFDVLPQKAYLNEFGDSFSRSFTSKIYFDSDVAVGSVDCLLSVFCEENVSPLSYSDSINLNFYGLEKLSSAESGSYESGYNAGYSDGQTDGYNNGYSQGFLEGEESGFQAGQDSVDTDSYYDAGYEAGYSSGYNSGYSSGYSAGFNAGRNVNGTVSNTVLKGNGSGSASLTSGDFYVSSHAITDRELLYVGDSSSSTWFFDTVPDETDVVREFSYLLPLQTWGGIVNENCDGVTQGFSFNVIPSLLYNKASTNSAVYWDCFLEEAYIVFEGKKYYATIDYDNVSSYEVRFNFYSDLPENKFFAYDYTHSIHFKVRYSALVINDSGQTGHMYTGVMFYPNLTMSSSSTYDWFYKLHYNDDLTGSVIQDQTDKITGSLSDGFNDMTNGFNSSGGDAVNSDLSAGLNEYQTAEDSLWTTATTGLSDFTFFNIASVPAMVTGISFVTSTMTGWFNQAGGVSGVGIVLSILFSVMLVAMVLGLYRWYQSRGGKG